MRERGIVRVKRQRNKRHEPMRFFLKLAQLDEVIDALFFRFYVPVKHRSVRTQPDFMRLPRNVQPHLPTDLVVANNPAHARMKDLRAAAGQRINSSFLQFQQRSRWSRWVTSRAS